MEYDIFYGELYLEPNYLNYDEPEEKEIEEDYLEYWRSYEPY